MMKSLYAVILLYQYILISAELKITKQNDTEVKIKELEKTKEELLRKINGAIDDSVVALEKTNDSESAKGLHYLTELKKQIKDIKSTESDTDDNVSRVTKDDMPVHNITDGMENFRRKGKQIVLSDDDPQIRPRHSEFTFTEKKKRKGVAATDKQRNIEESIAEWVAQKASEKAKIRKYREMQRIKTHKEICPNFGVGKSRKELGRAKSKGMRRGHNYPCCRKCCKYSYLGCL